ncbi:MAG: lipopolysaccharide biosynthesis protein, partial [Syntrophobacteraceae bacterium]
MEQQLQFQQIKSILWRRKWWLAVPFIIVVSVVTIIAVVLPSIYVSSSTILIQDPQIPDEVVKTGVTSYADQRIQSITQEIMSRSKILALVAKYDLLPKKREKLSAEEVVDAIRDRIKVNTIDAEVKKDTQVKPILLTIAFELSTE